MSPVELDPVTFEVIRHRLWAINDDQATLAARLSGSPVVYEAYDFNAALLTADGRGLCAGIFIIQHAATVDYFVQQVLERWPAEEINAGDMFFTNDPWAGALHANDGILAAPIFWDGRIVAWSGVVMHDNDVGSPVPGSFVVGAADRFGEAPLLPPVKLGEDFELRPDLEAAFLRNHRTPELSALNLRARLAALRMSRERLHELIEDYGVETFVAAQEELISYTERIARSRLGEIPDGEWFEQNYLDHDGNQDKIYPIRCRLTKSGGKLTFDFTGTAAQAEGAINCARPAMEASVIGVFFAMMCYDLPWSVGAARRLIDVVSEPGTVNNAISPAGVSMASVMATLSTQDAVSNVFAKMLMSSEAQVEEAQACWASGQNLTVLAGADSEGEAFALPLLDCCGGGGGARSFADGVDAGGILHSVSASIPNVETTESRAPVMQLYRRHSRDSGGVGRFRGGAGIEFALISHGSAGPVADITIASGVSQPEGHGLSGGGPAAVKSNVIARDSDILEMLSRGAVPAGAESLECSRLDVLAAKDRTELGPHDVHFSVVPGGGGFGDPLGRDPQTVMVDVREGMHSPEVAREVYGVVMVASDDGTHVDLPATEELREGVRRRRMSEGRPASSPALPASTVDEGRVVHPLAASVEVVEIGSGMVIRCTACHCKLGDHGNDHKRGGLVRELPLTAVSALNAFGREDEFVLREYSCPGCGTGFATDVQRREEPLLDETRLAAPSMRGAEDG